MACTPWHHRIATERERVPGGNFFDDEDDDSDEVLDVPAGPNQAAIRAILRAADNEVRDAHIELSNAERARTSAHANAAREFAKASEQYASATRQEAARKEAAKKIRFIDPNPTSKLVFVRVRTSLLTTPPREEVSFLFKV